MKLPALLICLIFALGSCRSYPDFLPEATAIHQNVFGSEIHLKEMSFDGEGYLEDIEAVEGELLAVADSGVFLRVLADPKESSVESYRFVERNRIEWYKIYLFQASRPAWSFPVLALASLSHGFFGVITLPINMILSGVAYGSLSDKASYTAKELPYEEISKYARFPQGLPPGYWSARAN